MAAAIDPATAAAAAFTGSGATWAYLAVVASCAIPGIFPAQPVGPYMLVDGGVLNPIPVTVAADMGASFLVIGNGMRLLGSWPERG